MNSPQIAGTAVSGCSTCIVPPSYDPQLVATGLTLMGVSEEPLVAIYTDANIPNCYHLIIGLYVPAGSMNMRYTSDINDTSPVNTEAGKLTARNFMIEYTVPTHAAREAFDLWNFHIVYQVADENTAQAVRIRTTENDPITKRGTVTTVIKS